MGKIKATEFHRGYNHNYLQPTLQWWQQHLAIATQHHCYHNSTLVVAIGTHNRNRLFHRGLSVYISQRSL